MRNFLVAALALALTGCSMKGARIPEMAPRWAKAGYTVMGKTTEEACGTYILGIDFGHLFANQGGSIKYSASGGPLAAIPLPIGGPIAEEKRALYHALDKIPEATHLLDVRMEATFVGVGFLGMPFFGQRCATVHARGVIIDERPNPQQ